MQALKDKYHCVGCGRSISWNGKGVFAYTCLCGATLFADEKGNFSLPASLVIGIAEGKELPHLDYYLGISNYVSAEKQRAYEELQKRGCTWSWNCPKCKDRFLKLKRGQVKAGMIPFKVHPELQALLLR